MPQPPGHELVREASGARPGDSSASGIREPAFVLKENVRGFGWGRWKGHTQGSRGDQNKQAGANTPDRFLRPSRLR